MNPTFDDWLVETLIEGLSQESAQYFRSRVDEVGPTLVNALRPWELVQYLSMYLEEQERRRVTA